MPNPEMVFGPVPSRRLGRSLGLNNIPAKKCTYSCIYCQLGATVARRTERGSFYSPDELASRVAAAVDTVRDRGETIDYLTFVADGEPTLDLNLGRAIRALKPLGIRIAVITNGSLLWREEVRADLAEADWVSVKVDSVDGAMWCRLNEPHRALAFDTVLTGIKRFAAEFEGELVTETMLVHAMNCGERSLKETALFIAKLAPRAAYLAIPTRPPANDWVHAPDDVTLATASVLFGQHIGVVKYLFEFEGSSFSVSGDAERDLLSIAAVHPLRSESVAHLLEEDHADGTGVRKLVDQGKLVAVTYEGHSYYRANLDPARLSS